MILFVIARFLIIFVNYLEAHGPYYTEYGRITLCELGVASKSRQLRGPISRAMSPVGGSYEVMILQVDLKIHHEGTYIQRVQVLPVGPLCL